MEPVSRRKFLGSGLAMVVSAALRLPELKRSSALAKAAVAQAVASVRAPFSDGVYTDGYGDVY
jgi:hypothetical protein